MTIKYYLKVLLVFILPINCFSQNNTIDYLGQTPPGDTPIIFAPGLVSLKGRLEQGVSISPDGKEFLFGVVSSNESSNSIYYMERKNDNWSLPIIMPFIGKDSVFFPMFSPDGKSFVFSKRHPNAMQTDIWICNRTNNGWTIPERFPSPVNSEFREGSSGLTLNRALYFTSNRDTLRKCCGDIFRSKPVNGEYLSVERLDSLNTPSDEEGLFVSPEEDYVIIQSWQVKYHSKHDLYISYLKFDNSWSNPERVDSSINTTDLEQRPFISPDKKYLFFNRMALDKKFNLIESDIYWVSTRKFFKPYTYRPISDTVIIKGNRYHYTLPMNTFKDVIGRELTYKASLSNGENLPGWLQFDSTNQTFSGTPNDTGEFKLKITVFDEHMNTCSDEFILVIK
jgi:hypothetical protein